MKGERITALIALDMDGTLLTPQHELTIDAAEAIAFSHSLGVLVCLATGRRRYSVAPFCDTYGLPGPHILADGAHLWTPDESISAVLGRIRSDQVAALVRLAESHGATIVLNGPSRSVAAGRTVDIQYMLSYGDQEPWVASNYDSLPVDSPILQVLFVDARGHGAQAALRSDLTEDGIPGVHAAPSAPGYLNCSPVGVSKGSALVVLSRILGLTPSHTAAVGDGLNDVSMFRAAGYTVAMDTADPALQELADEVAAYREGRGIGQVIRTVATRLTREDLQ